MIGAVLYLSLCSLRNRVKRQRERLRSPRYLVALVLGILYLWFFLLSPRHAMQGARLQVGAWLELWGAVVLLLVVARWWLLGTEHTALAFSPAEIQFLFAAPIPRHGLIQFKLIRIQLVLLVNTVLWTVFLRGSGPGLTPWLRAIALWTLFSTLYLHRLGCSLTRAGLGEHGPAAARRRIVTLGVLSAAIVAFLVGIGQQWPALRAAWDRGLFDALAGLRGAAGSPWLSAILLPFRLLLRPVAATATGDWAGSIGPALAIMFAHYVWVVRSDRAFEESALAASARRARRQDQWRVQGSVVYPQPAKARRAWIPLSQTGIPAMAIVWKNLIAASRDGRVPFLILSGSAVAVGLLILVGAGSVSIAEILGMLAITWATMLIVTGPQFVRYDLRRDLTRIHQLRSYPLSGAALVGAEVLGSTIVLTTIQVLLAFLGVLGFARTPSDTLPPAERPVIFLAVLIALPAINLFAMAIQNAGALLYPSWVRLDARPGGVEALGQNVLTMAVSLILLGVAMLGPGALGSGLSWLLGDAFGVWALVPGALMFSAALLAEALLVIGWLGSVFERTDPGEMQ